MNAWELNAAELNGPSALAGALVLTPGGGGIEFLSNAPTITLTPVAPLTLTPGGGLIEFFGGLPTITLTALPAAPPVQAATGIWLVEADAAVAEVEPDGGLNGTEMDAWELNAPTRRDARTTLRFTDASPGYATAPGDSPADTPYDPSLVQAGYIERNLSVGASRIGFGEILLASGGHLDPILNLGLDGQQVLIRRGPLGGAYPADFPVQLRATLEQPEFSALAVRLKLRDRLAELEKPLLQRFYGGGNVLPDGVDGTADDLKGKPKPQFWGQVLNVSPPLVNTSKLIYQVNDEGVFDVTAVYDRGAPLSRGADYADLADMMANAPAPGSFRAWLGGASGGAYFRLGASPAGQVTFDGVRDGVPAQASVAHILGRIAQHMGIALADRDLGDQATLEAAAPAEIGVWVDGTDTALTVMDRVAASVGAWYGFDRLGWLRMGRLEAPGGTPVAEITEAAIVRLERSSQSALPAWRVKLGYGVNHTVQASDLAGSVAADRRAWLSEASRAATADRASVLNLHKLAIEMERDTLLVQEADARAEAIRLLGLHAVRRDTFRVLVRLAVAEVAVLDLGKLVRLIWPRYGLDGGRLMIVVGMKLDFQALEAELTLWG